MVGFEGFGKPKTDRIRSRRAFDSCGVSEIFRFADLSGERKGEHQKGESARTHGRCSLTNETILIEKIKGRGVWIGSTVFYLLDINSRRRFDNLSFNVIIFLNMMFQMP